MIMVVDEFLLKLDDADTLKVSIWESTINNKKVYHAKYINVNLGVYLSYNEFEKRNAYGIDYRKENGGALIYYSNKEQFINDLKKALLNGPRLTSKID